MRRDKADLIVRQKLTSPKGLIREITIWSLKKSERYPSGIKYRLVLADPATGKVHLLYDNHWPKGHHVHFGDRETSYDFVSLARLIQDFRELSDAFERSLP